jgi:bifunctional oligoribonuclease and PAP phosphatase NrnA
MNPRSALIPLFRTKERFLLLIHHSPDGDSVASSLALALALRQLEKSVDIVCADAIPQPFQFLPGAATIRRDFLLGDYDVIVTLDCGDARRTGFSKRLEELIKKNKKLLINIDHHPKNDLHRLATYNYVDYSAASTSVMVYALIRELSVRMDHKLATCILTGLYTDTGGFKHANTTPETLTLASELLSYGARLKDITKNISQLSTVARLKLWGIALSRIQHHASYDIISTFLSYEDIERVGADETDIAGIASLVTTIPAQLAVIVLQLPDKTIQVRMRTKNKDINVDKLAGYLGGGGQRKSAGFMLHGILGYKGQKLVFVK